MGAASGPSHRTWRRRCGLLAAAAAGTLVALLSATARKSQLGLLRTSYDGLLWAAEPPVACSRWHSTSVLGGGCLAELPPSAASFDCCGGANYTCSSDGYACPVDDLLPSLRCVSPRQMLLRLPPGCSLPGSAGGSAAGGAAAGGATGATQLQRCRPSADAVAAGSWVESSRAVAPGVPSLQFQPACSPGGGSRLTTAGLRPLAPAPPLAGPEALQRLWAAGFDRVVISGDSTVRHLYNRLVGLIRQQDNVIDGGGIAHAHYKLQTWPSSSGGDGGGSSSGSGGGSGAAPGPTSSARTLLGFTTPAAGGGFATDELWVSPPANFVKGDWDEEYMEEGLLHLLNRTFSANSASSGSSSGGSSGGGSGGDPQLSVDFLVGAHARWQMRHMRRYLAELAATPGADGGNVLAVLSLCVWEQKHVWPNGWLDFLAEVRQQVGQVVLLTCPTDRIRRDNQQQGRKLVAERNRLLRAMVAAERGGSATAAAAAGSGGIERQLQMGGGSGGSSSGSRGGSAARRPGASSGAAGTGGGTGSGSSKSKSSGSSKGSGSKGGGGSSRRQEGWPQPAGQPLMLVDIDGLTQDLPSGLAVAPLDYHYACMLANPAGYNSTGEMLFTGGDGRPQPTYQPMRYDRLLVPPAGRCDDPVNFASLQLLLSLLG